MSGLENPSAAYLAGQQHGAALAAKHAATPARPPDGRGAYYTNHAAAQAAAASNTKAGVPVGVKFAPGKGYYLFQSAAQSAAPHKPKPSPGGLDLNSLYAQAQKLAQAQTAAEVKAIQAQQAQYRTDAASKAAQISAATKAAAGYLGGLGDQTAQSYTDAAKALGGLASGFSGQVGTDATNAANAVQANLGALGAPAGGAKTSTGQVSNPQGLSNVLYGLGGFIPGNELLTSGTAAAAAARQLPSAVLGAGQGQAAAAVTLGNQQADSLSSQLLAAQAKGPATTRDIYNSLLGGVKTQADLAATQIRLQQAAQRIADAESNQKFGQWAKVQSLRQGAERINQAATRMAQQQFNSDRSYAVSLANLGIRQKSQQLKITASAFKAAHGGYTQPQLKKFATQALGLAQSAFHGTPRFSTKGGVSSKTVTGQLSYGEAMTQMLKKGLPVQVVLDSLNQVYGTPTPDQEREIEKALGPLTPAALKATVDRAAQSQTAAGYAISDPSALLTGSAFRADSPVAHLTSVGGEHPTEGLPGFPAHDYFAPAGSRVVAPVTGTVIKLSGHDPRQGPILGPHGPLGWSVYIKGTDGRTYYLTHMGSRAVRVGETLRQGQPIGTVADYAKYGTPSHIHLGVSG